MRHILTYFQGEAQFMLRKNTYKLDAAVERWQDMSVAMTSREPNKPRAEGPTFLSKILRA
jgi:hypothetical protein